VGFLVTNTPPLTLQ